MTNEQTRSNRVQRVYDAIKQCANSGKNANRVKLCYYMSDLLKVSPGRVGQYILELINSEKIEEEGRDLIICKDGKHKPFQEVLGL